MVAVMITEAYGKELEVQLQRNLTVLVQLQAQRPQARGSLVLVSISFMVLMIISSAWLVFYFIQKLRHSGARHRSQVRTIANTIAKCWNYDTTLFHHHPSANGNIVNKN